MLAHGFLLPSLMKSIDASELLLNGTLFVTLCILRIIKKSHLRNAATASYNFTQDML